ncbi:MAG: hypothetical protein DHS20C01_30890 [marine bacterium B5-7]|nr:MAG: hypothetical protein DHS20C01_30890 [marine bacterium B5-7]
MTDSKDAHLEAERLARVIAEKIPFNREMGFEFDFADEDRPVLKFEMKPELVGNFMRGNLHGGVISSSLDVIGGFAAFCALLKRIDLDKEDVDNVFAKLGTIDLRVDYLRPGLGRSFQAEAYILRVGRKVAVTRMELHNDSNDLVAAGTGAYIVG